MTPSFHCFNITGNQLQRLLTTHDPCTSDGHLGLRKNAFALIRLGRPLHAIAVFLLAQPPMLKEAWSVAVNRTEYGESLGWLCVRMAGLRYERVNGIEAKENGNMSSLLEWGVQSVINTTSVDSDTNVTSNQKSEPRASITLESSVRHIIAAMWMQKYDILSHVLTSCVPSSLDFPVSLSLSSSLSSYDAFLNLAYTSWLLKHLHYVKAPRALLADVATKMNAVFTRSKSSRTSSNGGKEKIRNKNMEYGGGDQRFTVLGIMALAKSCVKEGIDRDAFLQFCHQKEEKIKLEKKMIIDNQEENKGRVDIQSTVASGSYSSSVGRRLDLSRMGGGGGYADVALNDKEQEGNISRIQRKGFNLAVPMATSHGSASSSSADMPNASDMFNIPPRAPSRPSSISNNNSSSSGFGDTPSALDMFDMPSRFQAKPQSKPNTTSGANTNIHTNVPSALDIFDMNPQRMRKR